MKRYDRSENSDEFSYIEAKWTKKTDILMSHQIITVRKNREDTVKVFLSKFLRQIFAVYHISKIENDQNSISIK